MKLVVIRGSSNSNPTVELTTCSICGKVAMEDDLTLDVATGRLECDGCLGVWTNPTKATEAEALLVQHVAEYRASA